MGAVTTAQRRTAVGAAGHAQGVRRLVDSFRAIPPGQAVRLGKRTSNLFRPRERARAGLDVSGLDGVIGVDPVARTADVQGMCTYETLVEATLAHGLMPLVVPQLRTITLGGAVTGLGIESTSWRNGLPHESVIEMDVLLASGEIVTCAPDGPEAELFHAFPNSYGSLGYAVRLRIELMPIAPVVTTRNVRFGSVAEAVDAIGHVVDTGEWAGQRVDAMDGVVFGPDEVVLVLADLTTGPQRVPTSDYTGQEIFYRSLQRYDTDHLTAAGYIWRWDTDWFWCSNAFGVQNPRLRRLWPSRYRRSDVFHRIVGLENRYHVAARIDAARGERPRERVVQDVEVPAERLSEFVEWFDENVGMTPVWLCPLRLRERPGGARDWPLYPLEPGRTYVNVGFWGTVEIPDGARDGDVNRAIEHFVTSLDGHKSLYSDAYYDRQTFDRLYGGQAYAQLKRRLDPSGRFPDMYEKVVGR